MKVDEIHRVMALLREEYASWRTPAVTIVAECERSPFKVLVSCIISLRTKDEVTAAASARMFARADSAERMLKLAEDEIAALIYPAGFYRTKAGQIHGIAHRLVTEFGGNVPDEMEDLLRFRGVGRKTANLVLTLGFGKPGICVDTHVHRICNRLGYVSTRSPEQTEMALRAQLPGEYWIAINDLLVAFGQNHCHPISPRCTTCRIAEFCSRVGVKTSR
ncbi:endonuclease III domain-containing protein [Pelobacter propionicus]|uniref:HhH-GPD family protein n=1 Tax=Pelobacter propionicus (strain DSM 2379 / NBRC 103807 / OttBd1) TaxID=338966 RepID=A1ALS4_PELPD|nr:endonuclease III [Pelobacter propionicus]ABK98294.1 HhH-GPD family protein [Pelobacter propionicus DSM 2379]